MRPSNRYFLFAIVAMVLCSGSISAQCPEDTLDTGECDTVHVMLLGDDLYEMPPCSVNVETAYVESFPCFVHVPLLVTHDLSLVDGSDSIRGMTIPLVWTHTNSSAYCSVSDYWNNTNLYGWPTEHSIFRHLEISPWDTMFNWMMSLSEQGPGMGWTNIILNLDGTSHFWLTMLPTTQQLMGDVERALIATMTFKIEDTMSVIIDSTFLEPADRLTFSYSDIGLFYIPRHKMPVCFKVDTVSNGSGVQQLEGSENSKPHHFSLSQNYPNPFNPITNIEFNLSQSTCVRLEIFNILGQKVRTLVDDQELASGEYIVDWDGKDGNGNAVSSGIYFYQMKAGDFSEVKKMLFLK